MKYLDASQDSLPSLSRNPRIAIRVELEPSEEPVLAVVDTAAPWCVFKPNLASILQPFCEELPGEVKLSTRLGTIRGRLSRIQVKLPAEQGEPLQVQATVFFSPDWTGENFLGYEGLLQRIRFAVDPREGLFYFGDLY